MDLWGIQLEAGELTDLTVGVLGFCGVVVAAVLAYHFATKQSRQVHNTAIRTDRLRREIAALEAVWTLLAYMSDKKSDKAILHWTKDNKAGGATQYFYHYANLERFLLQELSAVFYQQHAGLFISEQVRDLLYAYRAVVAGFYFSHPNTAQASAEGLTLINKPEQVEKLKALYADLNRQLRMEIEQRYRALEV